MSPDSIIAGMMHHDIRSKRAGLKLTILHRPGVTWSRAEVARLCESLMAEVQSHPRHTEHLIVYGHVEYHADLSCVVTQVTGIDDPMLPWRPSGWVL